MAILKRGAMIALTALAACAPAGQGVTRLGQDPALSGGTFSTGGGLTVATELREQNGMTALCGAWSESRSQVAGSRGRAINVIASGSAYLDGERLWSGLSFMRKVPPTAEYSGKPARCVITTRPWSARDTGRIAEIRLPRQEVYRDREEGTGGPIITFRQTGPGALSGALDLVQEIFDDTVRIPLGQTPVLGGGRYSSGGGLTLAAELRQIGKEAYVCGAWTESRSQSIRTEKQAPEVLARGELRVGDKPLIRDLRFFRRVSPRRTMAGRDSNCLATGTPWEDIKAADRVSIHLENQIIYWGPGPVIRFVPSGPGA